MDYSTFYFWHSHLGPHNIIISSENGAVGIIDWEIAGFVPLAWIRTKFGISWARILHGGKYMAMIRLCGNGESASNAILVRKGTRRSWRLERSGK